MMALGPDSVLFVLCDLGYPSPSLSFCLFLHMDQGDDDAWLAWLHGNEPPSLCTVCWPLLTNPPDTSLGTENGQYQLTHFSMGDAAEPQNGRASGHLKAESLPKSLSPMGCGDRVAVPTQGRPT